MSVLTLPAPGQQRAMQARRRLALKALSSQKQHRTACERMHQAAIDSQVTQAWMDEVQADAYAWAYAAQSYAAQS